MPALTALLHTHNDALRLGRALETLYACDHIVIIDHNSRDATAQLARQYGARIVPAQSNLSPTDYITTGYILCLAPNESISENLATSLFELKQNDLKQNEPKQNATQPKTYSLSLREETAHRWVDQRWINHLSPQTRIVPCTWPHWIGNLPANDPASIPLEGELLRFAFP
jgi:glycosyltransferase involved in cell wall biosynthesis